MAISKILHMGCAKSGFKAKHLANAIQYITKDYKTENGLFVSGHNCLPETALKQMLNTKQRFGKMGGRQGYHIIISFEEAKNTVNKDIAMEIIGKFTEKYLGKDFEAVYVLHDDTEHVHGHIVFNSVRCIGEGLKYDYRNGDWDKIIQPLVNKICEEYQMATLDMDRVRENRKKKKELVWDQSKNGEFVWNDMIRRDLNLAAADAENWDEFLIGMEERGYEVKQGAHILVKPPGMKRGRRLDTLGGDYTEEAIRKRLNQPLVMCEGEKWEPELQLPPRIKKISGYIPRRKSLLMGYQKLYFAKLYRLGVLKKQPYSSTWKYKEDIRRLHQLQEEYNFLSANGICTDVDLERTMKAFKDQASYLRQQERRQKEAWEADEELFGLWEQILELEVEVSLYEEGYLEFREEYEQSLSLKKQLEMSGQSVEEVRRLYAGHLEKNDKIQEVLSLVRKQQRIGRKIMQEQRDKIQNRKHFEDRGGKKQSYDF